MYADLGAKATVVKGSTGYDPQPNFTAPEAIQLATLAAVEHFEKKILRHVAFLYHQMTIPYLIAQQTQKKPSLPSAIFAGDRTIRL